jgi:TRAP-type C4-dicarboxylate transport system substrate-binding protein
MGRLLALCVLIPITAAPARAEPLVLRMATVAPEGSSWAREMHEFGADLERRTHGEVRLKLYLGGVIGDDLQSLTSMQHGQVDAVASGGMLCEQLAPSLRVLRLLGAFRSAEENRFVRDKLTPLFDEEFHRSGYVNLAYSSLGGALLFSRTVLRSMADLKRARFWVWDIDPIGLKYAEILGVNTVSLPLQQVRAALDRGELDAVFSIPSAALVFQWYTRLKYYLETPIAFVNGCMIVDARVWGRFPPEVQTQVRAAAVHVSERIDEVIRHDDAVLLERLRAQGVAQLVPSEAVKGDLFEAYLRAREHIAEQLIPSQLVRRVIELLQAHRAKAK